MYIRVETNTREGQLFERTNIKHNIHKTLNINKLRITYMNIYQLYLPVLNSSVISFEGLNIKYVWILYEVLIVISRYLRCPASRDMKTSRS